LKLQIGIDDRTYEVDVEILEDDSLVRTPGYLPPHPIPLTVASTPVVSAPKPVAADSHADESKVCRSPVAGVVLRVTSQPGQQLQPNDLMMVLEAMKMETNVTAPVAGKVKIVNVNPGDAVKVNQVLVEFE
jgi:methylmalonyl-CoA carboxyltransferase 1.3S subunit